MLYYYTKQNYITAQDKKSSVPLLEKNSQKFLEPLHSFFI